MDDLGLIIAMIALVMLSAFFSATETAFNTLSLTKIKIAAEHGGKSSKRVLKLLEDYNKLLSTILVGNNVVNIALSSIATVWFIKLVGNEAGPTAATLVITVVVLIFGEITPKNIAKERPESFAKFASPIIEILEVVLAPVNFLFSLWKKLISKLVKSSDDRSLTEEEFLTLVDEVEHSGEIGEQESELIRSALELNENNAGDVATPRVDVTAIQKDATKEEIMEVFSESGYSRLPVYDDGVDDVVGIIHQIDFYKEMVQNNKPIEKVMKKPLFVPETIKIGSLLKILQKEKCHMAIVTDEYGGTYGIATMEDILEELVGDIWDEHDEIEEDFKESGDGVFTVSGSAEPEELFENLGLEKDVPYSTVSGWVMDELDKIPEVGDSFESDGYNVTVTAVDGMRADTLEIRKAETEE